MLKSRNNFIRNYLSVSLTEQHMATLASIIKDVDKDVKGIHVIWMTAYHANYLLPWYLNMGIDINWRTGMHVATFIAFFLSSGSSDEVFSLALYHFNHTLVTSDLPSPALQVRDKITVRYGNTNLCCHINKCIKMTWGFNEHYDALFIGKRKVECHCLKTFTYA